MTSQATIPVTAVTVYQQGEYRRGWTYHNPDWPPVVFPSAGSGWKPGKAISVVEFMGGLIREEEFIDGTVIVTTPGFDRLIGEFKRQRRKSKRRKRALVMIVQSDGNLCPPPAHTRTRAYMETGRGEPESCRCIALACSREVMTASPGGKNAV